MTTENTTPETTTEVVKAKPGRPVNPNSVNAQKKAAQLARIAAGEVVKRGRPKMIKPEVAVEVTTDTNESGDVAQEN